MHLRGLHATCGEAQVHKKSVGRLVAVQEDPRSEILIFHVFVLSFNFLMLMLVTADNFIQILFGWEGLGLASYLLMSFCLKRLQAPKSSIKAMLVNADSAFTCPQQIAPSRVAQDVASAEAAAPRLRLAAQRAAKAAAQATAEAAVAGRTLPGIAECVTC